MQKTKKIDIISQDGSINLALDTIKIGKQAFVFVNTKRSAEKSAEDISKKIKAQSPQLDQIAEKALKALSRPTHQCERLAFCLKKGIAFHHAGLAAAQRELIEDEFRKGTVKIICCTPTLAAGVDLPAFRAIIKDLKRYTIHGLSWIPVLDYMQMSGRAGRPNYDKEGQAIALEPFATAGTGRVKDAESITIFRIDSPKPVRNPEARKIIDFATARGGTLPFSERWLPIDSVFKMKLAMRELREKEILYEYPALREVSGALVSQAEHSIIIGDKPLVITK